METKELAQLVQDTRNAQKAYWHEKGKGRKGPVVDALEARALALSNQLDAAVNQILNPAQPAPPSLF